MKKILIRFATKDDFRRVRLFDPHSKYIDPEKIKTKIETKEVILAFDGNKLVGIIKFSYLWATRPYMDLIWVLESYRGNGVGSQLLTFLEKFLVESGYVYLYTSSEEDEEAPQKWHQSHGFKKCGVLSAINLPQDQTNEVFFYKHLTSTTPEDDKLKAYPV